MTEWRCTACNEKCKIADYGPAVNQEGLSECCGEYTCDWDEEWPDENDNSVMDITRSFCR